MGDKSMLDVSDASSAEGFGECTLWRFADGMSIFNHHRLVIITSPLVFPMLLLKQDKEYAAEVCIARRTISLLCRKRSLK